MKQNFRRLFRYLLLVAGVPLMTQGCLVHRPAIEGHLYDSVTKEPISGATVRRVISYTASIFPDPGGGGRTNVVVHDEQVTTTQEGSYSFPSITRMKLPWGDNVEDQLEIHDALRHFNGLYPKELWTESIYLVPRVDNAEACRNNVECLKENEGEARGCYDEPDGWGCKRFGMYGYSRFVDTSQDFIKCNGMQGFDGIHCITEGLHHLRIPDENSCAQLNDELVRNYCYLYGVWNDWWHLKPTKGCDRITDKKIPADWKDREDFFLGQDKITIYDLDDFKAICVALTRREDRSPLRRP